MFSSWTSENADCWVAINLMQCTDFGLECFKRIMCLIPTTTLRLTL